MSPSTGAGRTLGDCKRDRTRKALIDAAVDLFERHCHHDTTAADIGTRTFFGYFASKEDLLLPDSGARVAAAAAAIAARGRQDRPADGLLRALHDLGATDGGPDDMVNRVTTLRLRLIQTVPAVRGRALQLQLDTQREIAPLLQRTFPDDLDDVGAAALVGAFTGAITGAITGALQVLLDDPAALNTPDQLRQQLRHATAPKSPYGQRRTGEDGRAVAIKSERRRPPDVVVAQRSR